MSDTSTAVAEAPIVFEEMVATLIKPGAKILSELTPHEVNNLHMAIGIAGESAELLSALEKYAQEEGGIPDRENIIEEMGDYEFYAEGLRTSVGLTLEQTKAAYPGSPDDCAGMIYDPQAFAFRHGALIAVAGGDTLDAIKKQAFYRKDLDLVALAEALGRIERSMEYLRSLFDISLEEVRAANIVKLVTGNEKKKARYAEARYSDHAAQTRADKAEG